MGWRVVGETKEGAGQPSLQGFTGNCESFGLGLNEVTGGSLIQE